MRRPEALSTAILALIAELPLPRKELLSLDSAWPAVVGLQLARQARPSAFTDGELHLAVDHVAWARSLEPHAGSILAELRKRTGIQVEKLVPHVWPQRPTRRRVPTPDVAALDWPDAWTDALASCPEPETREALRRMLQSYSVSPRGDRGGSSR